MRSDFLRFGLALALAASVPPAGLSQPADNEKLRVAVIGDSLAEGFAPALTEALADVEKIEILRRARGSSGFVRDDYYDWRKAAREIVAEGPIAAAVILIGVNDRQTMQTQSGRVPPLSDEWRKEYVARVDDVLQVFREAKAKIYWVGLPPMPPTRVSSDMAALNEIFRERTAAAGGRFIDIWDGFANDDGRFTSVGPDLTGSIRRLRASDGVHFARAGYEKLAHFVEREIRADFAPGTDGEGLVATPDEAPETPPDEAPVALAPPGGAEADPKPGEGESAPKRPPPGPVVPLTGGGSGETTLAGAERKDAPPAQAVAQPKPGRADDFHWPR